MGVKHLWDILSPACETVPLIELKNKTLAIDLSGWICESQILNKSEVRKPYLRNIFFRISKLLNLGAIPVVILDGEVPDFKLETICKRMEKEMLQEKLSSSKFIRRRLNAVVGECKLLLESLGICYVQAPGEAEAYCAFLNQNKLVDGCITHDSDAFLYGATVIYKNFSIDTKYPHASKYELSNIRNKLKLTREKLIALAVLLGCDYIPQGVPGIGKESALKLLDELGDTNILKRFFSWKKDWSSNETSSIFQNCCCCKNTFSEVRCIFCDIASENINNLTRRSRLENMIAKKSIATDGFPFVKVITEYLNNNINSNIKNFQWKFPSEAQFMKITINKLGWHEDYSFSKIFPLQTYWILCHPSNACSFFAQPLHIVKSSVKNGIPCFNVEWKLPSGEYPFATIKTLENQELFKKTYPNEVENFLKSKKIKKCTKLKKRETPTNISLIDDEPDLKEISYIINLITEESCETIMNNKVDNNKNSVCHITSDETEFYEEEVDNKNSGCHITSDETEPNEEVTLFESLGSRLNKKYNLFL